MEYRKLASLCGVHVLCSGWWCGAGDQAREKEYLAVPATQLSV